MFGHSNNNSAKETGYNADTPFNTVRMRMLCGRGCMPQMIESTTKSVRDCTGEDGYYYVSNLSIDNNIDSVYSAPGNTVPCS